MERLYIGNDHLIELAGLKDQAGAIVTSATLTAQIMTHARVAVGDPITLTHEGAGTYTAVLDAMALTHRACYYLSIAGVVGSVDGQWDVLCRAEYRE